MATVLDFKAVMGEIKEVDLTDLKEQLLEDIMELKSERVREITAVAGNPDPETGEDSYRIIVECYPDEGKQYGRKYSNFFPDSRISGLLQGLNREDYYGKDVEIGFVWRKWEQEGQPRKSRNLTSIKLKDIDANADMKEDIQPGDAENPLLTPVATPGYSQVTQKDPVLEPVGPPTPPSTLKPPPGKGTGRVDALTATEKRQESGSIARNMHVTHAAHVGQGWYDSEEKSLEALLRLWMFCKKMYRMELPEIKGE